MSTNDSTAKLVEAFHLLYDVKDTLTPGSDTAYTLYEAIKGIRSIVASAAVQRHDGEGRADGPAPITPRSPT
jgi:hypothetical protein